MIKDRSYFRDYLCKYLTEEDDPRKDDDAFIDARAELAAATMEETRLKEGLTVKPRALSAESFSCHSRESTGSSVVPT